MVGVQGSAVDKDIYGDSSKCFPTQNQLIVISHSRDFDKPCIHTGLYQLNYNVNTLYTTTILLGSREWR